MVTQAQLARSLDVTPQAVSKRAKNEAWIKASTELLEAVEKLPVTEPRPGSALGKRSPENIAKLINTIARTGSEEMGCHHVGIDAKTLYNWKKEDSELSRLIQHHRANDISAAADCVFKAARKDPKVAMGVLARDPRTRDTWGEQHDKGPTIVLNIHRDEVVIEGEK